MLNLSRRDRRALLLGPPIIGCALLLHGMPGLIRSRSARLVSASAVVAEASRRREVIRLGPALHDSLVARRVRLMETDSSLVAGDSPSEAVAELAEIVSDAAEDAKAQLGALQLVADSTASSPLTRARVHASVTGDLSSIARMLAALEAGPPMVSVIELSLSREDVPNAPNILATLRVELLVEGLSRNSPVRKTSEAQK